MPSQAKDDARVSKADRRTFFATLFAHGGARVLSKVASAPLDRVKICLQVSPPLSGGSTGLGVPARGLRVFRGIFAEQGVLALWRGAGAHIAGTCLGGVVRLSVLRTSQMWAMPGGGHQYQGAGAFARRCAFLYAAGAAAMVLVYPLDVAYTCLAADSAQPRRFRSALHFMRLTRARHGVRSLYRGLPLSLGTAAPFVLVATAVHDVLAPLLLRRRGQAPDVDHSAAPGDPTRLVREGALAHLYPWNLLVGAAAGFVAQSVTYPLDTARRRWQHGCTLDESPASLRQCIASLYERGGWRAFYAGYGVNTAKLLPELIVLSGAYLAINASGSFV